MKKIMLLTAVVLLSGCTHEQVTKKSSTSESAVIINKPQITSIDISFLKKVNQYTITHFNHVRYGIEAYVNQTDLSGDMKCVDSSKSIDCHAVVDMNSLAPGIYRVLIKSESGLLGSDIFEKTNDYLPLYITIDNESTGNYLIALITAQTGFREDEIYRRVAHILSDDAIKEYNLEPTLYDLFMAYGGADNAQMAITKLVLVIKENKPINAHKHKPSIILNSALQRVNN